MFVTSLDPTRLINAWEPPPRSGSCQTQRLEQADQEVGALSDRHRYANHMNFIENESATKLRGGYYTEPPIARFLVRWVSEIEPTAVLEPGCGDGAFFKALEEDGRASLESVVGFEIDPAEAQKATRRARGLGADTKVIRGDYLEWSLKHLLSGARFDAAIGNPPFIRYQYLDERSQELAGRLFEAFGLPFTRHTNAWVPFVIAAMSQLRPGGRLAMVVPSELLHVLHAQSLRNYLISACSRILVIDPQELFFDKSLQGVVLLMAEKAASTADGCKLSILPVRGYQFLQEPPAALMAKADFVDARAVSGKWMTVMLTGPERRALDEVAAYPAVHRFANVAQVDVGIVTGANKFFLVSDAVVRDHGLERWAHPMFGRSEHVRGVVYDARSHAENRRLGLPTNFIHFGDVRFSDLPGRVREYIETGEGEGLHRRYKCRIRSPWYSVPSVWSSPIGMLKRSHDFPRLVLNAAGAFTTDTAYRIQPMKGTDAERLVYSFVNSATMLSAELEGRHYGGGVLELVPSEIEKLLVPLPLDASLQIRALDRKFRRGDSFDDILSSQDDVILKCIGLSASTRARIFGAWDRLRNRRQRASPAPNVEAA